LNEEYDSTLWNRSLTISKLTLSLVRDVAVTNGHESLKPFRTVMAKMGNKSLTVFKAKKIVFWEA
jgi:hypothetical protein